MVYEKDITEISFVILFPIGVHLGYPALISWGFWDPQVLAQWASFVAGLGVSAQAQLKQSPTRTARPLSAPYVRAGPSITISSGGLRLWHSYLLLPHNSGAPKAVWCQSINKSMHPWAIEGWRLALLCYEMWAKPNHTALRKLSSFWHYSINDALDICFRDNLLDNCGFRLSIANMGKITDFQKNILWDL